MDASPRLPDTPFCLVDLPQLGLSRHALDQLIRQGRVRRVTTNAYVDARLPWTVELRAQAMIRVLRPHEVLCDRTAAWIWGVDAYSWSDLDQPPIETAARIGRNSCKRQAVSGHTRDLADRDVTVVGGVPVTTPLRTALDLGCILERRDALAALDALRRLHGIELGELSAAATRFRGRRGVVQLRELVPLSDPRAESQRESWTRLAIVDAGLPSPEPQVWIEVDGVPVYRLDLAYRRRRVAVEYDGWDAHERNEQQRRHDEERRAWLRAHGWIVIVVRKGDFTGEALARWLGEVREALRSPYSNRRRLERGDRLRDA